MASIADLQAELHDRQRRQYQRLQRAAAEAAFQRKHGRPPADLAELERAFLSRTIATVDPSRHLSESDVMRILSTATGA